METLGCPSEETIVAFTLGRLAPEALAEVESHALRCASCRDLLAVALGTGALAHAPGTETAPFVVSSAPSLDELDRGATVGRYTILGRVGRGGMGEVYAAFDPQLDRKVALKLLRRDTRDHARAQARFRQEAKTLAKLSHPNVVMVHDVGTFHGRVFIAIEFVAGTTLREWLRARQRTIGEIIAVFKEAALGLSAAHASGLVHRDFKPTNVMIGHDGVVRVMDFGLARSTAEAEPPGNQSVVELPDVVDLTRTGELVGTPSYMAPEQFLRGPTDARTDQFSFCVALYEALYDALPFGRNTLDGLKTKVVAGRVDPPPARSSVPPWLRRAVLRGLSSAPADRWPSLSGLAAALERDPTRARRRRALATAAVALVVACVLVIARRTISHAPLCRGGPGHLVGVWESAAKSASTPRRAAVESAFIATKVPGARDVWERIASALVRYRAEWLTMYRDACESTQVRHEQPAKLLELRMECLDDHRMALDALTNVFAAADPEVVRDAVDAVNALPPLGRCADRKQLEAVVEPPRDEPTRRRVEQVRQQLAVAKALNDTGKHAEAMKMAGDLLGDVRALGYRPLLAETLMTQFRTFAGSNFRPEAVSVGEEVVWTSLTVGRDDLAAEAAVNLAPEVGSFLDRYDEGRAWAHLAKALLDRSGKGHELLQAWLATNESYAELKRNPQKALELSLTATTLKQRILPPDHPDIATDLVNRAEALAGLNRVKEALAANATAYDIFVRAYGPASIEAAHTLSNQGEYLIALGRPAEALDVLRRALANWEAQIGPDHEFLAYPLTALGRALLALGRPHEALQPLERAFHIVEHAGDRSILAEARFALARALWDAGLDHRRARQLGQEARAGFATADDAKHLADVDRWLASRSVKASATRR